MLEAAFLVVRRGAQARPPLPVPPAMRPLLRFQKLPGAALAVVRRALDEDAELRARVAPVATDDVVGALGARWLLRPEGWEAEVEALRSAAPAEAEERDRARDVAQAKARALGAEVAVLREELERVRAELADHRDARTRAERSLAEQSERLRTAEGRLAERDRTVGELRAAHDAERTRADEATEHLAVLGECLADLERARDAEAAARAGTGAPVPEAPAPEGPARAPAGATELGGSPPPAGAAPWAPAEAARVAAAVQRAADAAGAVGEALAEAAVLLGGVPAGGATPPAVRAVPPWPGQLHRGAASPRPRRRARPLPGGVLDDSVEAVGHLLRLPRAVVLVDGYNVAKLAWPALPPPQQRQRLVDALEVIAARTGSRPVVVFDGADVQALPTTTTPRHLVQVRFSPPGVEADDVVLAMVAEAPASAPVVVVSSDGRVRDGAREQGANVLSSAQLRAAMGA